MTWLYKFHLIQCRQPQVGTGELPRPTGNTASGQPGGHNKELACTTVFSKSGDTLGCTGQILSVSLWLVGGACRKVRGPSSYSCGLKHLIFLLSTHPTKHHFMSPLQAIIEDSDCVGKNVRIDQPYLLWASGGGMTDTSSRFAVFWNTGSSTCTKEKTVSPERAGCDRDGHTLPAHLAINATVA